MTPGQCTGDDQLLNTCTGTISLCLGTALRLLDLTTKDWYKKSDLYLKSTLQVNYVQYTVQFLASNLFPHSIIYKSIPNWNSWVFFPFCLFLVPCIFHITEKQAFKIFSISHIKKKLLTLFLSENNLASCYFWCLTLIVKSDFPFETIICNFGKSILSVWYSTTALIAF